MISGVNAKNLKNITDERGRLMEMMRNDENIFVKFGQVYLTTNYPGVVKAWHYHKIQSDYICCVRGMIKVVLYDARKDSTTYDEMNEFCIGDYNPMLIVIPPGVYHGWKCISDIESLIINVTTEPYKYENPDEFRLPPDSEEIPYKWVMDSGKIHG